MEISVNAVAQERYLFSLTTESRFLFYANKDPENVAFGEATHVEYVCMRQLIGRFVFGVGPTQTIQCYRLIRVKY